MKNKVVTGLLAGLFVVGGTHVVHATTLANGNFDETADLIGTVHGYNLESMTDGQWDIFDSLPDWSVASGSGIEVHYNTLIDADSPNYSIELDSSNNTSIYQTVFFDQVGTYDLSFMYYARTNNENDDNGIEAFFNGSSIGSISKLNDDTPDWELVTMSFEVTTLGNYDIGFSAYGEDNSLGGFIDTASLGVSVADVPVPEPATMLLFGAGLVGLAGVGKRRSNKK